MTKIEWVRADDGSEGLSWNALRAVRWIPDPKGSGMKKVSANHCEHVNEACRFCYADRGNARLGGLPFKPGHRADYTFEIDEKKLLEPLRRKKPTRIFVESMSDAFGEWWPDHFIDKLYAVMALCPQHTFINLSKRPERRQAYLSDPKREAAVNMEAWSIQPRHGVMMGVGAFLPLPNIIEGVSVSCQEEADAFVPILLNTPAGFRCVSAEPLLGPIDFRRVCEKIADQSFVTFDALAHPNRLNKGRCRQGLDWVIVGGESGPQARPMHVDWARSIRDQCASATVPFFFKQRGEYTWLDDSNYDSDRIPDLPTDWRERTDDKFVCMRADGSQASGYGGDSAEFFYRVGKKAAGRLLDGREWNEFPQVSQRP